MLGGHLRIVNCYVFLRCICSAESCMGEENSLPMKTLLKGKVIYSDKDWIP